MPAACGLLRPPSAIQSNRVVVSVNAEKSKKWSVKTSSGGSVIVNAGGV